MKNRLFCWSGGGLPGLDIHVGIWMALSDAGIESTANAGTSAGSIIAAFNSAGKSALDAEQIIENLKDSDIRRERSLWKLRIPWIDSFLEHAPIEKLLRLHFPGGFNNMVKPISIFVTHEASASCMELTPSDHEFGLRNAILASMSIMGVFPPVNGCSDGGPTAYLPLPTDWEKYDEVWLLIAKRPLAYHKRTGILTRAMFNADILYEDQVRDTIAFARQCHNNVFVVRPEVSAPQGSLHFDHRLINEAYTYTKRFLAAG